MTGNKAAYRYAVALWEVADEARQTEAVFKDIQTLKNLLKSSDDFYRFVDSPRITADQHKVGFKALFKNRINKITINFLYLLIEKGRVNIISAIINQFFLVRDDRMGIAKAVLTSTVSMSENQKKQLVIYLENQTGKTIELEESINESMLGGFAVRVEDTIYDASIKHQLELLGKKMLNNQNYNPN